MECGWTFNLFWAIQGINMIERRQIPHSYTVLAETGHIQVRLDTIVQDMETGEIFARQPWRGVVAPGDTAKADSLLGDSAPLAKALAGKALGGWDKLEQDRAAMIAAEGN
jgi:hypothetical protein